MRAETRWSKPHKLWYTYIGGTRSDAGHKVKKDAIAAGRVVAKKYKAEHIIKNKDGKIAFRNSYGNDSRRRPG